MNRKIDSSRFQQHSLRTCPKTISSPDSEPVSMRFRLSDESADAEGAIGDEETNEMSRKEPEDGELRVLGQVLRPHQDGSVRVVLFPNLGFYRISQGDPKLRLRRPWSFEMSKLQQAKSLRSKRRG